jgi:hypothetical protein
MVKDYTVNSFSITRQGECRTEWHKKAVLVCKQRRLNYLKIQTKPGDNLLSSFE